MSKHGQGRKPRAEKPFPLSRPDGGCSQDREARDHRGPRIQNTDPVGHEVSRPEIFFSSLGPPDLRTSAQTMLATAPPPAMYVKGCTPTNWIASAPAIHRIATIAPDHEPTVVAMLCARCRASRRRDSARSISCRRACSFFRISRTRENGSGISGSGSLEPAGVLPDDVRSCLSWRAFRMPFGVPPLATSVTLCLTGAGLLVPSFRPSRASGADRGRRTSS